MKGGHECEREKKKERENGRVGSQRLGTKRGEKLGHKEKEERESHDYSSLILLYVPVWRSSFRRRRGQR